MRSCQARPPFPDFVPQPQAHEIIEPAALDVLASYEAVDLPVAGLVCPVRTTYVGPSLAGNSSVSSTQAQSVTSSNPPLLLLHAFDSSAVEWRRLLPLLAQHFEVYAIDLLGYAGPTHFVSQQPPCFLLVQHTRGREVQFQSTFATNVWQRAHARWYPSLILDKL
jgi:pimeloyl-ACP methyl ester carboxylesterase